MKKADLDLPSFTYQNEFSFQKLSNSVINVK